MLSLSKARLAKRGHDWFEYRLARDLGLTVRRLRQELTTAEFTGWVAFYTLEAEEQERQAKAAKRGRK